MQAETEEMVTSNAAAQVEAASVPTHTQYDAAAVPTTLHQQDFTTAEDEAGSIPPHPTDATTVPTLTTTAVPSKPQQQYHQKEGSVLQ